MGAPRQDPGSVIMWILALILFVVLLALLLNLFDVHT